MSDENEKKINYKILTADHLLEGTEAESKEAIFKDRVNVEPEVVKKVDSSAEITREEPNLDQEKIEFETKLESGVVHPTSEEILPAVDFQPTSLTSTSPITIEEQPAITKETLQPEYFSPSSTLPSEETPAKPKFEIIKQEELISEDAPQLKKTTPELKRRKIDFKLLLRFILPIAGGLVLVGFIMVFKPYQKFIFSPKSNNNQTSSVEDLAIRLPEIKTTSEPLIIITSAKEMVTSSISTSTISTMTTPTLPLETTSIVILPPLIKATDSIPTPTKVTSTETLSTNENQTSTSTKTTSAIPSVKTPQKSTFIVATSLLPTFQPSSAQTTTKTTTLSSATNATLTITTKTDGSAKTESKTSRKVSIKTKTSSIPEIKLSTTSVPDTTVTKQELIPTTSDQLEKLITSNQQNTFSLSNLPAEIITFPDIEERKLELKEVNFSELEKNLVSFIARQDFYSLMINLKILVNEQIVPWDLVFSYFIRPTKIKETDFNLFKQSLTNKMALLIYYGHTREYPILIFETKDSKVARLFNNQWMKGAMSSDLQTLFLGATSGKVTSRFTTKKFNNVSYNIIYFQNNFQLCWLVFHNYVVYSSSEEGLKKVMYYLSK
ncbi:MAG: hypothetical protein NZ822_00765 [Patescibacteria group bacterium]|nr:hypothetical protein [Patescibacteria group bacterium]